MKQLFFSLYLLPIHLHLSEMETYLTVNCCFGQRTLVQVKVKVILPLTSADQVPKAAPVFKNTDWPNEFLPFSLFRPLLLINSY